MLLPAPLTCSPSRSTLFTGLMPFRNGAHGNHSGVKEDARSLVHYLEPLGYQVAIAGKLHVGPKEVFPFERVPNTNVPEPGFEKKPELHYDLNMDPVDKWLSEQQKGGPFMLIVADHSPHMDRAKDHDGGREYWDSWREKSFVDEHAAAILWRYHNHPKEELYDVEADPQEVQNLATDPEYAELLENFREQLASWREQQGDFETGPEELPDKQAKKQKPVAPYVFLD